MAVESPWARVASEQMETRIIATQASLTGYAVNSKTKDMLPSLKLHFELLLQPQAQLQWEVEAAESESSSEEQKTRKILLERMGPGSHLL